MATAGPPTVFDAPQWKWSRAYEAVDFAGLRNTVEIVDLHGRARQSILVNVPADFIRYLSEVFRVTDLSTVTLYLDACGPEHWMFGFSIKEDVIDLWEYKKQLPNWIDPEVKSATGGS